jgi:hypothetical protein
VVVYCVFVGVNIEAINIIVPLDAHHRMHAVAGDGTISSISPFPSLFFFSFFYFIFLFCETYDYDD